LHDAVNDGPRNTGEPRPLIERQISDRFGGEVVKIVSGCAIPDYQDPQQNWQTQREIYLQQLETADQSALLVAAADKLHNLQSLLLARRNVGEQVWKHCEAGKQGSLWYFRRLGELLDRRWPSPLTTELLILIQQLQEKP
jgi:(p)ppGpp synthase/HD superfamily hydrolase